MKTKKHATQIAMAAMMLLGAEAGVRAQVPDSGQPFVQAITYGGTGCPQGSVGQSLSNDRLSYTLIFDSFVASTGPAVPAAEQTKSCEVKLALSVPAGTSIWVETSTARGYTQLPEGMSSTLGVEMVLSNPGKSGEHGKGNPPDHSGVSRRVSSTEFEGAVAKDYTAVDAHPYAVHADCGGTATVSKDLTLTYTVKLEKSQAQAQMTVDSLDGKIVVQKVNGCGGN